MHSFSSGPLGFFPLNSAIEQRLNTAKSNAGEVPTNMVLNGPFVAPPQLNLRPVMKLGYEKKRNKQVKRSVYIKYLFI